MKLWYTYIVRCADNSLYTGVTTDIDRRLTEHNTSRRGAKYTRSRRPVTLVYLTEGMDKTSAFKLEAQIKKKSKRDKEALLDETACARARARELVNA